MILNEQRRLSRALTSPTPNCSMPSCRRRTLQMQSSQVLTSRTATWQLRNCMQRRATKGGQLGGISFSRNDLSGWDFSGQDLSGADLSRSSPPGRQFRWSEYSRRAFLGWTTGLNASSAITGTGFTAAAGCIQQGVTRPTTSAALNYKVTIFVTGIFRISKWRRHC